MTTKRIEPPEFRLTIHHRSQGGAMKHVLTVLFLIVCVSFSSPSHAGEGDSCISSETSGAYQEPADLSIIGFDSRVRVDYPQYSPFSPVGLVLSIWDDTWKFCTGTLVSRDIVMTGGHCITDADGILSQEIYFAPSFYADPNYIYLPFDYGIAVNAIGWNNDHDDIAFFKIDKELGRNSGYFNVILSDKTILEWLFPLYGPVWGYNPGYPTDKDGEMWYSFCSAREWFPYYNKIGCDCDILEGSSGSPFLVAIGGVFYAAGILVQQVGSTYATNGYGFNYFLFSYKAINLMQSIPEDYYYQAMAWLQ